MQTQNSGVIVGVRLRRRKNDYDGHTLEPALQQYQRFYKREPKKAIVDLGYRGINKIGETEIITPNKKGQTSYEKTQLRNAHRRRSAIEAGISHLKNYYRLGRNFYRNVAGDSTNLLLAVRQRTDSLWRVAVYNFKRMMNIWKEEFRKFFVFIFYIFKQLWAPQKIFLSGKMTF